MTELLNEIEQALADLLRMGLATGSETMPSPLRALAERCESGGLHTGAALLAELADGLAARAHTLNKDDLPLTETLCRLAHYRELCAERQQEEAILHRWQEEQNAQQTGGTA